MQIELIGVPLDFGAGIQGTALGPHRLREIGLTDALSRLGHHLFDRGDVEVPSREARP